MYIPCHPIFIFWYTLVIITHQCYDKMDSLNQTALNKNGVTYLGSLRIVFLRQNN